MISRNVARSSPFRLLTCILALGLVVGMPWLTSGRPVRAAGGSVQVTIHYFRFDGSYTGWDNWIWDFSGNGAGNGYPFNGTDSFGAVATATVPCTVCTQMGFIVREGGNAWTGREPSTNPSGNRYIPVTNGKAEAWVITGDTHTYFSLAAAEAAKNPSILAANLDGAKAVTIGTNALETIGNGGSGFKVLDKTTHKTIKAVKSVDGANFPGLTPAVAGDFQSLPSLGGKAWDPNSSITRMKQISPDLYRYTIHDLPAGTYHYKIGFPNWSQSYPAGNITLEQLSDGPVTFWYIPSTNGVLDSIDNSGAPLPNGPGWQTNDIRIILKSAPKVSERLFVSGSGLNPVAVTARDVLNLAQYTYTGSNLGATWSKKATKFRLWAPVATRVTLTLYKNAAGSAFKSVHMKASKNGTWAARVKGNLNGNYYLYSVTNYGSTTTAVDPYARDVAPNGMRAMIVDLYPTNPSGWKHDRNVGVANPVDASIYEVDVRDFSVNANSGIKAQYRGKYLAFTQTGTKGPKGVSTGVDSLKQLGVKDVELMPTYRFSSLDETKSYPAFCPDVKANVQNPCYNWGYDPANYNVPEGVYATSPIGTARITQFKQMVHSLHQNGLGVFMDVVYNHVGDPSIFNNIVPGYYFRINDFGAYYNGSGIGNEVATDRPQVFKFVEDSMKYWIQQYHIDGFRMDQMFLFGKAQLRQLASDLRKVDPGLVIIGEPWGSSASGLPANQQVTEGNQQGVGVGVFNDHFRNAVCCQPFNPSTPGYASGNTALTTAIETGVVGSTAYSTNISDFAAAPSETVNYVTDHDNYTLWDRINQYTNASDSRSNKILRDELAQAIVFTSQGIPFIQGGEEMLRTKGTGPNSGNSWDGGDADNQFDWSLKSTNASVFNYYAGLFHLRAAHPAFRMRTAAQIKANLSLLSASDNTVAFELNGKAVGDSWHNIIVMYNPDTNAEKLSLPSGNWKIAGTQGQIGLTSLGSASGTVSVPALTTEVLYR